jgi:AcrR family transcriptional regulator
VLVPDTRAHVLDGVMACLARWGVGKATLDDIATASGCSRATIYRLFPGGKEALFSALVEREVSTFFADVDRRVGDAETLAELLSCGIRTALEQIWGHAALRFVVQHEPGTFVPNLISAGLAQIIDSARTFVEPRLREFVGAETAPLAAEWVVRMTLSYASAPPPPGQLDEALQRLVEHLLTPGINSLDGAARQQQGAMT